jgi:hypothetical protein
MDIKCNNNGICWDSNEHIFGLTLGKLTDYVWLVSCGKRWLTSGWNGGTLLSNNPVRQVDSSGKVWWLLYTCRRILCKTEIIVCMILSKKSQILHGSCWSPRHQPTVLFDTAHPGSSCLLDGQLKEIKLPGRRGLLPIHANARKKIEHVSNSFRK